MPINSAMPPVVHSGPQLCTQVGKFDKQPQHQSARSRPRSETNGRSGNCGTRNRLEPLSIAGRCTGCGSGPHR